MPREKKSIDCKHCGRPSTTGYSAWENKDPFIQAFKLEKKLKYGEMVICPVCKSKWIKLFAPRMDSGYVSLNPLQENDIAIFEEWNQNSYLPTKEQLKVLKKIGATPMDAYGNGSEYIQVPCKCILKDGREIDFCIVRFQRLPPMDVESKDIIYITDVKKILPSDYTLSPKVRLATAMAEEIRNSYAPTVVRLPTGGKWIFNWTHHFFGTTKIKGKDIVEVLNEDPFEARTESEAKMGSFLESNETIIYADWQEEYLELEIK